MPPGVAVHSGDVRPAGPGRWDRKRVPPLSGLAANGGDRTGFSPAPVAGPKARKSPMSRNPRVLFICRHNSGRSQIAEAYLRKFAGRHFEVHSAGLEPAERVHP
ncbi:MAG TPA: hypothetical protein VK852_03205, partial [Desulfobacterales bacterium]|nr:hypothetical protein [Desulfobacterales bacterium]